MRDDHLEFSHKVTPPGDDSVFVNQATDFEEFKRLLFDLVKGDQVAQVQRLLTDYQGQEKLPSKELQEAAAEFSSRAMIELLLQRLGEQKSSASKSPYWDMSVAALRGGNIDTSKYLAPLLLQDSGIYLIRAFVHAIFKQDSEELCRCWVDAVATSTGPPMLTLQRNMFSEVAIEWTASLPVRELYMLSIWERLLRNPRLITAKFLGSSLVHVAGSTSSIRLAEWLIDRGAKVDFRVGERFPTALQTAAQRDTVEAALLLRFLLFQGADPSIRRRNRSYSSKGGEFACPIEEEQGPKNISKWLRISWAELVAQAATANGKGRDISADNQDSPVSEAGQAPTSLDWDDS